MKLPDRVTIGTCEKLLADLGASDGAADLDIPQRIRHLAAGGEASLIQLLITWALQKQTSRIFVNISGDIENQVNKRLRQNFYVVLSLLGRSIRNRSTKEDIGSIFLGMARHKVLQDHYDKEIDFDNYYGRNIGIICADHLGLGKPEKLYHYGSSQGSLLRDPSYFDTFSEKLIAILLKDERHPNIDVGLKNALGGCIYELVSNTHDHGKVGLDNKDIPISVRGLHLSFHSMNLTSWEAVAEDYRPLKEYVHRIHKSRKRHFRCLELSVFDSGVGYAQRWLDRPLDKISEAEELEAITTCFGIEKTSKGHSRFGEGLPLVVHLLRSRNGFLRLRTGRFSVFRDLGQERDRPMKESVTLDVWDTPANATVEGTLITLLIPLNETAS